ncbi:MAG: pyruvate, phosphate dikinase [bacterium]|nr:pyruvate, phosphate dikinase [bacterium]
MTPGGGSGDDRGVPAWRTELDKIRETRSHQFLRVSRKMLNHLCSIGLADAERMLDEVDDSSGDQSGPNMPGPQEHLEGSVLMEGRPFELADRFLGDDEILTRLRKWLQEDKASFFSTVVGDPRSTMPEIAEAIRRYNDVLRGRSGLAPSTLKSLRVSLIQRFLTEQLDYITVGKEVVRITDFHDLLDRIIMTGGCMGKLGGKAAGMLLAKWILETPEAERRGLAGVKTPRTWYMASDAVMDFIKLNDLDDVMEQKFKDVSQVRREYPNLIKLFRASSFPSEVIAGLTRALEYFGEAPLIVRSSSLLEDRFGTAFSGKYKSLFVPNQGTRAERLDALLMAVAEVWASTLGPDPIEYRRERGLQEFVEEMGILIQEVVGTRVGPWYLPAFAGVAYGRNEFRWSSRIQREDGLLRLVPGLGTRAVDRTDDFPVLAVPALPGLRANQTLDEVVRYSPRQADVINLEERRFETVSLVDLLRRTNGDYPLVDKIFSVVRGERTERASQLLLDPEKDEIVADLEGLLADTDFVPKAHALMTLLEEHLGTPVDIEFAHDGRDIYLLQCRPQAVTAENAPAVIPRDVDDEDVVFAARRFVSNGWVPDLSHVVWVEAEAYSRLPDAEAMRRVGRAVGKLNRALPRRRFVLMGPGRWGSRGDIKLGVRVTYADINNTAMLVEIARRQGNYVPDLSFGTHFFQDLVEADIRYLPLYPDDDSDFAEGLLRTAPNLLPEMLPEYADLAHCLRVIDVQAATDGRVLRVLLNADTDEALAMLASPTDRPQPVSDAPPATSIEPRQFWRWRFRMAERMVRSMDAEAHGVSGVYLYGSVKNGTAGPDSDIDLLVHMSDDAPDRRPLEAWFEGWSGALAEMNFSRTGVRVDGMLDVTFLTTAEVVAGTGLAAKIGAITDAARPLDLD